MYSTKHNEDSALTLNKRFCLHSVHNAITEEGAANQIPFQGSGSDFALL